MAKERLKHKPCSVLVSLRAKPRALRLDIEAMLKALAAGGNTIKLRKQLDRRGNLQVEIEGLRIEGFGGVDELTSGGPKS